MVNGFIVVLEEKHSDNRYWVYSERKDALKIAKEISSYWKENYEDVIGEGEVDIDRALYNESIIYNYNVEDCFCVYVKSTVIRSAGETEIEEGEYR